MKVSFSYVIGNTMYKMSVEVDEEEWSDLTKTQKEEYLKDEVTDQILIYPQSIVEE